MERKVEKVLLNYVDAKLTGQKISEEGVQLAVNEVIEVGNNCYHYTQDEHGDLVYMSKSQQSLKAKKVDVEDIRAFKKFINIPDFVGTTAQVKSNCINLASTLSHIPVEGDWSNIEKLFRHIFGDRYEYAIDYVQLLYTNPTQKLPIWVLVSEENATGKSTLLNLMKGIFERSAIICSAGTFLSKWTNAYASKVFVGIDEAILSITGAKERLKLLSTSQTSLCEEKNVQAFELDNHMHFCITSNDSLNCVNINDKDDRFWVEYVPIIKEYDPQFDEKIMKEIPAFLYALQHRTMAQPEKHSRTWFAHDVYLNNEQIKKIIENSKSVEAHELTLTLDDLAAKSAIVQFTLTDIYQMFNGRFQKKKLKEALINELKLPAPEFSRYKFNGNESVGKVYSYISGGYQEVSEIGEPLPF